MTIQLVCIRKQVYILFSRQNDLFINCAELVNFITNIVVSLNIYIKVNHNYSSELISRRYIALTARIPLHSAA